MSAEPLPKDPSELVDYLQGLPKDSISKVQQLVEEELEQGYEVVIEPCTVPARSLRPSQFEIGLEATLATSLKDEHDQLHSILEGHAVFETPIVTYNRSWVIDGHHRWSGTYAANPYAKLDVINVKGSLPPRDVIAAVHMAIFASAGATVTKSASQRNLFDVGDEEVMEYIMANLTPGALEIWSQFGSDSDTSVAARILSNVYTLIGCPYDDQWAMLREEMPQPEDSDASDWMSYLDPDFNGEG